MKINKKRVFFFLIIIYIILVSAQTCGLIIFGLSSVNIITSVLFLVTIGIFIFYLSKFLMRLFSYNKNKRQNIRLSIFSTFSALIIIEVFLRISGINETYIEEISFSYHSQYDPCYEQGWFHLWTVNHNLKTPEYNYKRTINSEMLSDKEHPKSRYKGEYRIIGLGDSFTEGYGAHNDSTWLKFLERKINIRYITYINAGACGSDPFFEYILLKKRLLKYNPDLVIVAINASDIDDIVCRGGMERFISDGTVKFKNGPKWEWLYATSYISRLFIHNLFKYNYLLMKDKQKNLEEKNSLKLIYNVILKFNTLSENENFKLLIIFNPNDYEITKKYFVFKKMIEKLNNETNINVLDLFDYFVNQAGINNQNVSDYYWKEGHHNAKGYELFADGVEKKIIEMGIIDSLDSVYNQVKYY
jgi:lysophospholipase L1-like esterase